MRVSDAPFPLEIPRSQPFIGKLEALTTMVVLRVVDSNGPPVLDDRAVLRHSIWNLREDLRKMDGGIRVMPNAEEQDLAVQFINPADGALETVRRQWQPIGRDGPRLWAERSKREWMGASAYFGKAPEDVGRGAEARGHDRVTGLERSVVVFSPRRHDNRSLAPDSVAERLDHASWSLFHRSYCAVRHVDDEHASLPHAERA
jgi:hypothetical protein